MEITTIRNNPFVTDQNDFEKQSIIIDNKYPTYLMIEAVLGFDSPSSTLTEEVLEAAKSICKSGALENESRNINPDIPCDLPDIQWGKFYHEKVDRTSALHYRLTVEEAQADDGFFISCESLNKDNFKVVIFDQNGALLEVEQSVKSRDGKSTQCVLYFNTCKTVEVAEPAPTKDKDPVNLTLAKLNKIKPSTKAISAGNYLLFVFGCNLFGKSSYRLVALPFNRKSATIDTVLATDESILDLKTKMEEIKTEYLAARKAYFAARDKVIAMDKEIENSLTTKDLAYRQMLEASMDVCDPDPRQTPILSPRRKQASSGLSIPGIGRFDRSSAAAPAGPTSGNPASGGAFSSTIDADSPVRTAPTDNESDSAAAPASASNGSGGAGGVRSVSFSAVSSSASAAGGWFSKTLTSGLTQLQTMRQLATTPKKEPKESPPAPSRAPTGLSIPSFFGASSSATTTAPATAAADSVNTDEHTTNDAAGDKRAGEPGDFNAEAHTLLDTLSTSRSPDAAQEATVMEKMRAAPDDAHRENLHALYSYDTPTKGTPSEHMNEFDSEAANLLKSIVPTPMSSKSHSPDNTGLSGDEQWKTIPTTSEVDHHRATEQDGMSHNMTHVSMASVATPVSALSAATKPVAAVTPSGSASGVSLATQLELSSPAVSSPVPTTAATANATASISSPVVEGGSEAVTDAALEHAAATGSGAGAGDGAKKNKKKKKAAGATGATSAPAADGDDYLPEI